MGTEYNTRREYIEGIALSKGIESLAFEGDNSVKAEGPQKIDEAGQYKHFWRNLFFEFKEDVNKIGFLYQEKEKELPLSLGNKFLKTLGIKVKPKIQEGEIKKEFVNSNLIKTNVPGTDTLNIITSENEWEILHNLAKESYGFSAPRVDLPEPLCYLVHIPLENIAEVRFKDHNFLNKQYTKIKC